MGILYNPNETYMSYLENHGFKKQSKSVIGECDNCYERTVHISNGLYYMWISIDTDNKKVYYYVEYDCGGEVSRRNIDIPDDINIYNEHAFMEWLDEDASNYAETV